MATLDNATRARLGQALRSCSCAWVACGFLVEPEGAPKLDGLGGLIDWQLHGQVSRQLIAGSKDIAVRDGQDCALFPGDPLLQRPSYLFYPLERGKKASALVAIVRKLQLREIALAETTFPEDFLRELKQNLEKAGVRCQRLEPNLE